MLELWASPDAQINMTGNDVYLAGTWNNPIATGSFAASSFTINTGAVMKPGDTAELDGNGVIYDLKASPMRSRGHYGKYGALEIVRRQQGAQP